MRVQKVKGGGGTGPFPEAVGVLGVTSGELYEDEYELMPWDPVPIEREYSSRVFKIICITVTHNRYSLRLLSISVTQLFLII